MSRRPSARLSTARPISRRTSRQRLHWSGETDAQIEQRVADILADVRQRGDAAVLDYTEQFDGLPASLQALELTQAELKAAFDGLPAAQREALQRPRAACAATTRRKRAPAARAGATATSTAPCWARR